MLMLITQCGPTLTVSNSLLVMHQMLVLMTQCRPTLTVNKSLQVSTASNAEAKDTVWFYIDSKQVSTASNAEAKLGHSMVLH